MVQALDFVGWIACIVYASVPSFWLMIHPRAQAWRSHRRSPYRMLLPLWALMWFVLGLLTAQWRHAKLYEAVWAWIPAALLFASGLWLYFQSSRCFSLRQLGGLPEVTAENSEQRLVTDGIRARVRHPVYLAHLCELLAWSIGSGLLVCYGLTLFAVITGAVMIRMEDEELQQRFGTEYSAYRNRVPALVPKWVRRGT